MKNAKRWLLPDGVEEVLPNDAQVIEQARRRMVDHFERWGYQLVIPPVLEFTDSLLSGVGSDLDWLTLKVTDQLSGRMMGLRADITPQAARMDAHSISHKETSRLCYASHVIHARPASLLANRTPLHAGVELFGEQRLVGDIEVISLLLASLLAERSEPLTLALGHVAVYKSLITGASVSASQEAELFELLQAKAMTDITAWVEANITDVQYRQWLLALPKLCGSQVVLSEASALFKGAPDAVLDAIDQLDQVASVISARFPDVSLYFDFSELRGYHYHTGIVFSAFVEGFAGPLANGGRYDHIGEAFGRARPATGFSINLSALVKANRVQSPAVVQAIYARYQDDERQWSTIMQLRNQGETVIVDYGQSEISKERCDRALVYEDNLYQVKALSV